MNNKSTIISRLKENIQYLSLANSKIWATTFVKLKMEFFMEFQNGYIFDTSFGANFFEELLNLLENDKCRKADNGGQLGEYAKNCNNWLKLIRLEK